MSNFRGRGPLTVAPPRKAKPAASEGGLFGGRDPGRRCGDCTACCTYLGIADPKLNKPAGTPCQHLGARGCGIYNQRPNTCRDWHCLFKRTDAVPLDARPDKLGVMFYFEVQVPPRFMTEHGYFVGHSLTDARAFETEACRAALQSLVQRYPHVPIWLSAGGQKQCVYPPSPLLQVIEGQVRDPALLPQAIAWLEGYAPLANSSTGAHSRLRDPNWRSRYATTTPPSPFQAGGLRFT